MSAIFKTSFNLVTPKTISLSKKQQEVFKKITSFVNEIDSFRSPKIGLEQYSLPSDLIALILILVEKDLSCRNVVDLGCGTGRLTLPVRKYFSNRILGVDLDYDVMNHLYKLGKRHNLSIDLLITPVEFLEAFKWKEKFHTTLMNPPFGTRRRKIDLVFLEKALQYSKTTISIHKSTKKTLDLITRLGSQYGKQVRLIARIDFPIFPSMHFHRKTKHFIRIDLLRLSDK